MYIRINEISREPDTGLFYFDIDFWLTQAGYTNGNQPIVSNDFRMQINPFNWSGGVLVARTASDIISQIKSNVADFVQQAGSNSTLRGDLRHKSIVRNSTDHTGVLPLLSTLSNFVGAS